jgi:hypothetical protein
MFKIFELKGGKVSFLPSLDPKHFKGFFISSVIILIVIGLSSLFKIDEKDVWKFYNLLIQQFGLKQQIPNIDRKQELDSRVEIEVDNALRNVESEYNRIIIEADKKYKPIYIDEINDETLCYSDECKALAPPMRLCAPWVEDCISKDDK